MVFTHSPPSVKAAPQVQSKTSKTVLFAHMILPATYSPVVNAKQATTPTIMEINARAAQLVPT